MLAALRSGCQSEVVFWSALESFVEGTSPSESEQLREAQLRVAGMAGAEAEMAAEQKQSTASVASSDAEGGAVVKRRGPKPLAERTPEQQAAHAAKKAAKAAAKASGASASSSDAEGAAPVAKPPKQQSDTQKAWIGLVSDTVKEMGAHGWSAWKDAKGVLWPASALNAEGQHVYSDGPHAGKTASHQRGGMARASFIKSQAVGLQGEWAEME